MSILRWSRSRWALVVALLVDASLGRAPIPGLSSGPALAAAVAAQESVTAQWLAMDGVVGTAVGRDAAGDHVVKVYLTARGAAQLPASVAGIPVEFEITGPIRALNEVGFDAAPVGAAVGAAEGDIDRRGTFARPVPIGVSTGHSGVTAGTIGARVTDGSRVFALSNNHVYANANDARRGDPLLQPGAADGGRAPRDVVASLHDFEPIGFCRGRRCPMNRMDAAIAATTTADVGTATPEDGYGSPRSLPAEARLGMKVAKYGRTTGYTRGTVTGVNAIIDVSYRGGTARFEDQILISGAGFSQGGDSGSLIVSEGVWVTDRRPVGLLFAGSRTSTIANPIEVVLDRFDVRIDEGG
ncbi:MAG TPA: hypothetical protein RMF84_15980 [Polyangiaceae bacterium LLY-WYZ-14_1]|nr:hypothetical protein [Polyangiaceae bacterium LLY-WYZ-14_1]